MTDRGRRPLTLHQLHAGISRARARRHETVPIDELGIALLATGLVCRGADHRYRTVHATPPKDGDARLVAALDNGSAVITTAEVADILRRTGLVADPGRGGSYHYNPFLIPVKRGHWTLISQLTSRPPAQLPIEKA